MYKLFISQPMKGLSDEEILAERERAIAKAKETLGLDEVEVIDSIFDSNPPDNTNSGLWYLGHSIMSLSYADFAYFAKGWENARGCRIEYECAQAYGIKAITEE